MVSLAKDINSKLFWTIRNLTLTKTKIISSITDKGNCFHHTLYRHDRVKSVSISGGVLIGIADTN